MLMQLTENSLTEVALSQSLLPADGSIELDLPVDLRFTHSVFLEPNHTFLYTTTYPSASITPLVNTPT